LALAKFESMCALTSRDRQGAVCAREDFHPRAAAFCRAFFCRRGRRDLFLGGNFPIFTDFVDGFSAAGAGTIAAVSV